MSNSFYSDKKVLVTGGTGLIGTPLVAKLLNLGAKVTVVSLDEKPDVNEAANFIKLDLRYFDQCQDAVSGFDYIFHLAGVKGSPNMTAEKPASFFVPTIMFNTNILEAARRENVSRFLYTSSIGVYSPAETFKEDDVWKTFPSVNDRFAGWAKRMGELQAEAYKIEHDWNEISIVRPANVYGPYDNFDPENAMVIPSLINRIVGGENPLNVWGDGSAVRDFIFSEDCAEGMLKVLELGFDKPLNLGSGDGVSVREIVDVFKNLIPELEVKWDVSKPSGDKIRLMDTTLASSLDINSNHSIAEGIEKTYQWYKENKDSLKKRYNSFNEK